MIYDNTEVSNSRLLPTKNISDDVKISDNVRDREYLITRLKSITPRNTLEHKLLSNPDYLNTLTLNDLKVILMERNKLNLKHTNNKTKGKVEKQRQYKLYNTKDNLGFRQCINRNQLPRDHALRRNPYLPIPKKRSLDWHYNIPSNYNTIFAYNKIKNLLHYLFIQHSKVYVIRMDLFTVYTEAKDLEKVNGMFNRLFVEKINREEHYLNYCCSREKSEEGIHLHCYFFFKDIPPTIANWRIRNIGEKWKQLGGKRWYSRNLDTGKLPHWEENSVIGRVDSTDFFKIERWLHCMKYLIKDLSNREWLDEGGINKTVRLFTCSEITRYNDLIRQYELDFKDSPMKVARGKWCYSYQWLYEIGLNYNDTIFKSNPKNMKFYRNRLKEPISRYLEKQKVDIHDYKRIAY